MPLESKALILAKIETTYGVDASPTVSADAILTTKPTIELIEENKDREVVLPYFGSLVAIPVATGIKIGFSVEFRGSGTPTTPPRIGTLLRACRYTQTTEADAVRYDPNSSQDGESITIYFYHDGILYKALGCLGSSLKLATKTNEIAKLDFEFTGMFDGNASLASAVAFPTPTFGDAAVPPIFRSSSFSFGGLSAANAIIDALEITHTNTVVKRSDANATYGVKRYSFTAREISGSFDPEVVGLGTWNPWSVYETPTLGALSATIGNTAGNRCKISAPNCQIEAPKLGARDGIQTYSIAFKPRVTLTSGNDEIRFRFN